MESEEGDRTGKIYLRLGVDINTTAVATSLPVAEIKALRKQWD